MGAISDWLARRAWHRPARLISSNARPYMYRVFLGQCRGRNFYLHHFVNADDERHLHDHPFDGYSLVLTGAYTEEVLTALSWPSLDVSTRRIRWFNAIAGSCFHRILNPRPDTWTLFVHPPKRKGWGFLEQTEGGIRYVNPFGNVGDEPWWETAPTYGELRRAELDEGVRVRAAVQETIDDWERREHQGLQHPGQHLD